MSASQLLKHWDVCAIKSSNIYLDFSCDIIILLSASRILNIPIVISSKTVIFARLPPFT